jgi:hypothetical protein
LKNERRKRIVKINSCLVLCRLYSFYCRFGIGGIVMRIVSWVILMEIVGGFERESCIAVGMVHFLLGYCVWRPNGNDGKVCVGILHVVG